MTKISIKRKLKIICKFQLKEYKKVRKIIKKSLKDKMIKSNKKMNRLGIINLKIFLV